VKRILRITFQSNVIFVQNNAYGTVDLSFIFGILWHNHHRFGVFLFEASRRPRIGQVATRIAQRKTGVFLASSLGGISACNLVDGANSSK
jgi:hypothetical protein